MPDQSKRVAKLEASLSVDNAILLAVAECLEIPSYSLFQARALAGPDPFAPAIQHALDATIRIAQESKDRDVAFESAKRAVFLISVFWSLIEYVSQRLTQHQLEIDVLVETWTRIFTDLQLQAEVKRTRGKCTEGSDQILVDLSEWRSCFINLMSRLYELRAVAAEISATYFHDRQLMFSNERDRLDRYIKFAEQLAELSNEKFELFQSMPQGWVPIDSLAVQESTGANVSKTVHDLVVSEQMVILPMFGQPEVAETMRRAEYGHLAEEIAKRGD